MKKLKLLAKILIPLGLVLAAFAIVPVNRADKIYSHIYIHGVPVGGLSRSEADAVLMERFQTRLEARTVEYTRDGKTLAEFTFKDFGAMLDFTKLLDAAFEYSYLRNFPMRVSRMFGRAYEINDSVDFAFESDKVEAVLASLSNEFDVVPVNASFSKVNGKILVSPESDGYGINIEAAGISTARVLDSFSSGVVELEIVTVQPRYTTADFEFEKAFIGVFESQMPDGSETPRGRNVNRAANRINNRVLFPNDVFSASALIGAHLPDSGYETAVVLLRGEPVEDIGGGVCQVVTALYNAVLNAELEVIQRHNHSARVSYADLGFDATVAGDYYDLKFKNNTSSPVLISSWLENNLLQVSIIGEENRPPERSIRFVSEKVEVTPPEPYREVVDPTVPRGERLITLESQMGYQVEVHKVIYMENEEVERVKISTSTYKPLQGIIAIGAG